MAEYRRIEEFNGIAAVNEQLPEHLRSSTTFTPPGFHRNSPPEEALDELGRPLDADANDVMKMMGGGGEWMYNTAAALYARGKKKEQAAAMLRNYFMEDFGYNSQDFDLDLRMANYRRLRRLRRGRRLRGNLDERARALQEDADKKRTAAQEAETDAEKKRLEAEQAEEEARRARNEADQAADADKERLRAEADEAEARARELRTEADEARVRADHARQEADAAQELLDRFHSDNPDMPRQAAQVEPVTTHFRNASRTARTEFLNANANARTANNILTDMNKRGFLRRTSVADRAATKIDELRGIRNARHMLANRPADFLLGGRIARENPDMATRINQAIEDGNIRGAKRIIRQSGLAELGYWNPMRRQYKLSEVREWNRGLLELKDFLKNRDPKNGYKSASRRLRRAQRDLDRATSREAGRTADQMRDIIRDGRHIELVRGVPVEQLDDPYLRVLREYADDNSGKVPTRGQIQARLREMGLDNADISRRNLASSLEAFQERVFVQQRMAVHPPEPDVRPSEPDVRPATDVAPAPDATETEMRPAGDTPDMDTARPATTEELRASFDEARAAPGEVPGIRNADFDTRAIAGDVNLSSRQFRILDALGGRMGIAGDMVMAGVIGGAAYAFTGDVRSGVRTGAETLPVVGSVMAFSEGRINEGLVRTAEDASGLVLSFGGAATGAAIGAGVGSFVPVVGTAIGFVVGGAIGLAIGIGASVAVSEAIRGAARLAGLEDVDPTLIETFFGDDVEAIQQLINMRFLIRESETELANEQRSILNEMRENIPAEEMERIENIVAAKLEEFGETGVPLETALRDPRIFFAAYEEFGGRMVDNPNDAQAVEICSYLERFLEQEEGRLRNEAALLQLQQAEVQLDASEREEYSRRHGRQVVEQAFQILNDAGVAVSIADISPELAAAFEEGNFTGEEIIEITLEALNGVDTDIKARQEELLENNLSAERRELLTTRIREQFGPEDVNLAEALRNPEILRSITDHYTDNPDQNSEAIMATLVEFETMEIKRQDYIRSRAVVEQGQQRALQMQAGMDLQSTAEFVADDIDDISDSWQTSIMFGRLSGLYSYEERTEMNEAIQRAEDEIENLYDNGSYLEAVDRARTLLSDISTNLDAARLRVLEQHWDDLNLDQFGNDRPQNAQELNERLKDPETYRQFMENQEYYFFNTSPKAMLEEIDEQIAEIRRFEREIDQKMGAAADFVAAGAVVDPNNPQPAPS